MKRSVFFFQVIAALIMLSSHGFSQWSTNPAVNNVICNLSGEQALPKIATCPNGDTYIGYFSAEMGNYNVRLQRLDAQGNILWAPNGILISSYTQNSWLTDWDMTCDGANHAILVFNDIRTGNTNVVAYRISPAGGFVWGAAGILLSNTTAFNAAPKVVATAAGNIIVAWAADNVVITQKISPSGTLQWGAAGITRTSPNRTSWPQLMPVGTDDVVMKYFDDSGPVNAPTRHVFAQRYNPAGAAVWSSPASVSLAGGISAWTQIFPFINDGSDGFYIAWHDDRDNNTRASVFVQHVSSTGAVLFTANGVESSSASTMNHFYPKLALPPGSSDIFVYWNEMNNNQDQWGIYGQKLNSAGVNQWGGTGMSFIPVSSTNVYPYEARRTPTDMILVYEEYTNNVDGKIKAMRISPSGTFLWTPSKKDICTVSSQKVHAVVNEFANNQLIATWEDDRNGNKDIYAQNLQLDGSLGPVANGSIQGQVTITGEPAEVTLVTVSAGTASTHPDAGGNYTLVVAAGNYSVTATHPYTTTQTINNVAVTSGQVTTGVNFTLTVNRADMIVRANSGGGSILNNVDVVIQGPEGPYTGTITNDSLVFMHVPYGTFNGSATYAGSTAPALSDTVINAGNHHLLFLFVIEGIAGKENILGLNVNPNPASDDSRICFTLPFSGKWSVELTDVRGNRIGAATRLMEAGIHSLPLREVMGNQQVSAGIYCLRLSGEQGRENTCKVVFLAK